MCNRFASTGSACTTASWRSGPWWCTAQGTRHTQTCRCLTPTRSWPSWRRHTRTKRKCKQKTLRLFNLTQTYQVWRKGNQFGAGLHRPQEDLPPPYPKLPMKYFQSLNEIVENFVSNIWFWDHATTTTKTKILFKTHLCSFTYPQNLPINWSQAGFR